MPLKTLVKVGNITNLSDARYSAGMGVDMLGFRVIEGQDNYIPAKTYQEIRGWVSGPQIVAEIYGVQSASDLAKITENFAPDYFEMTHQEYLQYGSALTKPAIVNLGEHNPSTFTAAKDVAFIITEAKPEAGASHIPVLFRTMSRDKIEDLLDHKSVRGFVLDGSAEERPGFKDYAALADILEFLDE